jgi:hypothetical protein
MPIERLKIKTRIETPKNKDEIPVFEIEGDAVTRYNAASVAMKAAESLMKELKPSISEKSLPELFQMNIDSPSAPLSSIKVEDSKDSLLRISFTSAYSAADAEQVEAVLESMKGPDGKKIDAGKFVQEIITAKFDSSVFLDAKGKFDHAGYNEFKDAIDKVAAKRNVPSPLSTSKVVLPLESFHAQRWTVFPTVEQQLKISKVLPNTVQFVPVKAAEPAPTAPQAPQRAVKPSKLASVER